MADRNRKKSKSKGSQTKSGEEENKESNTTSTTKTKNESGGNGRSKSPRNTRRTRKNSEEVKEEESNRTLREENNATGGKFEKKSKSIRQSHEDEDKDENKDEAKNIKKLDGDVQSNYTGKKKRYLKNDNKKPRKKSLSMGFPSSLVLGAVIVPLVIVTVCAGSLDCGAFYDSFKASIKESFSGLRDILDLIIASTNTGFCNLKAAIKEIFLWLGYILDLITASINTGFCQLKACIKNFFRALGYIFDLITASTNAGFCDPHDKKSCDEFLREKFNHLKHKYNDQSSDTWLTLYAAAYDHVSYPPNPQRPIVIMVYRLKNGLKGTGILEDIAGVYDSVLPPKKHNGNITIEGESFTNSSPEETQKQIQDMLETGFEKKGQKVAIVYDFDKLPSCSVLTFHNYCNNEDAPHKRVAIILTVTGMDEMLPSNPKSPDLEAAVGKLFHEKWKDCPKELPPGKIDAMLSRVANNVILLR